MAVDELLPFRLEDETLGVTKLASALSSSISTFLSSSPAFIWLFTSDLLLFSDSSLSEESSSSLSLAFSESAFALILVTNVALLCLSYLKFMEHLIDN